MPETKVEIRFHQCHDLSWFNRHVRGWAWWWDTSIPYVGARQGFARTREKARAKAEAAARKLTGKGNVPYERYTYEVTDGDA